MAADTVQAKRKALTKDSGARAESDANAADKKLGVAAVDRALSILGAFVDNEPSLSLSRIAQRTGLYKSTTLRLIDSLEAVGYIRRLPSGDYQLGPTLFRLGMQYQKAFNIGDFVLPRLQELVRETAESASFYVRNGQARLCLFRVDSPQAVRDHVRMGDELPLRKGAAGHVLIAFESGIAVARIAARDKFITVSLGERLPDLAAVAAPVFDAAGELAGAINVSGPRTRFTKQAIADISNSVLKHAKALTLALGGDVSVFPPKP
jgi:DNA-binding IclR family transcriptional regulator